MFVRDFQLDKYSVPNCVLLVFNMFKIAVTCYGEL